jgi:hypothetical protein
LTTCARRVAHRRGVLSIEIAAAVERLLQAAIVRVSVDLQAPADADESAGATAMSILLSTVWIAYPTLKPFRRSISAILLSDPPSLRTGCWSACVRRRGRPAHEHDERRCQSQKNLHAARSRRSVTAVRQNEHRRLFVDAHRRSAHKLNQQT